MRSFPLDIVTPDGQLFHGEAQSVVVATVGGEVGIMAGHTDYLSALGMGEARITVDDQVRKAACMGGMVSVVKGKVTIVATTFEWSDQIDKERAHEAEERAREKLARANLDRVELQLAEAKLKRALVRQNVAK